MWSGRPRIERSPSEAVPAGPGRLRPWSGYGAVEEPLFTIDCPTCERRLAVRSEAAIGAILTCPMCESMVAVTPPPGWQPPAMPIEGTAAAVPSPVRGGATGPGELSSPPGGLAPPDGLAPPPVSLPAAPAWPVWHAAVWPWRWPLWASIPVASVLAVAVGWACASSFGGRTGFDDPAVGEEPAESDQEGPSVAVLPPSADSDRIDRRWLPAASRMIWSLRIAAVGKGAPLGRAAQEAGPFWRSSIGPLLDTFKLQLGNLRSITWASTDLAAWPDRAVVVVRLADGQDGRVLRALGEPIELAIAGTTCRRLPRAAWSQPFAVPDERTIVTGSEDLLRELADRTDSRLASRPVERLLRAASPGGDFVWLVDLAEARRSGGRLPGWVMDVWPAGREAWHVLWEVPAGVGLLVGTAGGGVQSELALACEEESSAEKVRAAVEKLLPAAREGLDDLARSLPDRIKPLEVPPQQAGSYESLLAHARKALAGAKVDVAEQVAWVRIDWGRDPAGAANAALDGAAALRADWLLAARRGDEANHRRLLAGLGGYLKTEGRFPPGASGASLLPPDTRLSWIAMLLPYLERADWHRQLQFGYSWNSPQNTPVTRRPLEPAVNPALGPSVTEAGFPVGHYVGVAGVGPDAGTLKPDDPRCGLFGYGRAPRPEELPRGASNTLAVLGAAGRLGPWAAGGDPTVRPLTQRPYVDGPDGFGSGQPNGMLAGMADGSVRFISKSADPAVLEQLAALRGGPEATAGSKPKAAAGPKPEATAGPKVEAPGPEDDAEPAAEDRPAPEVDVEARLADRIAEINLPGLPLIDAVRLVGRISTVPITLDVDAMAALGVGLRDPVTVQLSATSTQDVLEAIAASRGLSCELLDDQVVLTCPGNKRSVLRQVKHDVADLVGSGPPGSTEWVAWIPKLVVPESWREAGGRGTLQHAGGGLVVEQTDLVHHMVRSFCDRLRSARGLGPQGKNARDKEPLATHLDRAWPKLREPVTATFFEKTPLVEILSDLEQVSHATILVNWTALAGAKVSPGVKATLSVHDQPLSEALVAVLQPLGLSYRIAGSDVFEVTTRKATTDRLEVEFYGVAQLLAKGQTPAGLMERIKGQVAGATWNDAGGSGVIGFDKPSGHLVVFQSQPIQVKVQLLLSKLTGELAGPAKADGSKPPPDR